jgi:DNA repair exonuclease SbcCD ATPase subunit
MRFLQLTVENFMSYEQAVLPLCNQGLVLIRGRNTDSSAAGSNGGGKSALIVDAWTWILYGKSARGLTGDKVVRRNSTGGCVGTLRFQDASGTTFEVSRYQQHKLYNGANGLTLHQICADGSIVDLTRSDRRETQATIEDMLGFPMQVALNAMVLGQNSIAFATMTDGEKKSVLEKLLEFDKLVKAEKTARDKVKELTVSESSKVELQTTHVTTRATLSKRLSELETQSVTWEQRRQAEIQRQQERISQVESRVHELEQQRTQSKVELESRTAERQPLYETSHAAYLAGQATYTQLNVTTGELNSANAQLKTATDEARAGIPQNQSLELVALESKLKEIQRRDWLSGSNLKEYGAVIARDAHVLVPINDTCQTCQQLLKPENTAAAQAVWDSRKKELDDRVNECEDAIVAKEAETCEGIRNVVASIEKIRAGEDSQRAALNERVETWKLGRNLLQATYDSLNATYTSQSSVYASHNEALVACDNDIRRLQLSIQNLSVEIGPLMAEWTSLKKFMEEEVVNPFTVAFTQTSSDLGVVTADLTRIEGELEVLRRDIQLHQFWVRGFGKGGIQSYLLDSVVPYLNDRVQHYANILWSNEILIEFRTQRLLADGKTLKEDFHIHVSNLYGADVYEGNSAGEQERIDICIALALQDLVISRQGRQFSLAIMDEVACHMDSTGVEMYYRLLEQLAKERDTVFVITHSPHLEALFPTIWTSVKSGGISRLEQ